MGTWTMPPDAGTTNNGTTPTRGQFGRGNLPDYDIRRIGDNGPSEFAGVTDSLTDVSAATHTYTSSTTAAFAGLLVAKKVNTNPNVVISGMFAAGNNGKFTITSIGSDKKTIVVNETLTSESNPLAITATDITATAATGVFGNTSEDFTTILKVGDNFSTAGFSNAGNNGNWVVKTVTATSLTVVTKAGMVDEIAGQSVTVTRTTPQVFSNAGGYASPAMRGSVEPAFDSEFDRSGNAFAFDGGTAANVPQGFDGGCEGFDPHSSKRGRIS